MPRPSLKRERSEAILDAVEQCIIRLGVHATTLDKIAEAANMRRSLLRHYIGNREDILEAFLDRFFAISDHELSQMLESLPVDARITTLLNILFDDYESTSRLALIALALTAAASSEESIRIRLQGWNQNFIEKIAEEIKQSFPHSSKEECNDVTAGLVGIYFNTESLAPLGGMREIRLASKRAAERLLSTLEK